MSRSVAEALADVFEETIAKQVFGLLGDARVNGFNDDFDGGPKRFVLRIGFLRLPPVLVRAVILDARVRHSGAILRLAGHQHPARSWA